MLKLILPPMFPDEERTQAVRMMYAVLSATMFAGTVFYATMLFLMPQDVTHWLLIIAVINGTGLSVLALARSGRMRLANIILFSVFWATVTTQSLASGGIHSATVTLYLVLVFLVGLLMGETAGIIAGIVCSLTGLAMLVAELMGALSVSTVELSPLTLWLNFSALIAMVMTLQFVAMRRVGAALQQARRELADRRLAEDAAHDSELRLRSVIDAAPLGAHSYELQADGRLVLTGANQSAGKILGIDHQPLIGKTIEEAFPGLMGSDVPDTYRRVAAHGQRFDAEQVTYDAKGLSGVFEVSAIQTGANRMSAFFRDISERKRAENALKESEKRFRLLYEQTPLGYQSLDGNGCFIEVNQAWLDLLGYARADVLGRWFGEFLAPDQVHLFKERFPRFVAAGETHGVEFEMVKKDGTHVIVAFDGRIGHGEDGEFRQSHCLLSNVTERKQAEEALRQSQERYRRMVDTSSEGIWLSDADFKTAFANKRFEEMFGYAQEELIGLTLDHVMFPEDLPDNEQRRTARRQGEPEHYERRFRHKDGHVVWTLVSAAPLLNAEGRFEGSFSMMADITERKAMEQALRDSEERFRVTFEQAAAGMLIQAPDGRFTMVNQTCCNIMGYTRDELLRLTVADITHEDTRDIDVELVRRLFAGEILSVHKDKRYLRKDGSAVWCNVNVSTVTDASGTPCYAVVVIQDISERKRAEERMRVLDEISLALSQNVTSYREELDRVAQRAAETVGDGCVITLLSDDGKWLNSHTCYHTNPEAMILMRRLFATQSYAIDGDGAAARVARTGRPELITDMTTEQAQALINPDARAYEERFGIRSLLMTPLRVGGKVIGAIGLVSSASGRRYVAEDQHFLQELADRAAQAVHNARLYQAAQRRMGHLQSLHTIDAAIAGSLDLHLTLSIALEQVVAQLGVDAADVLLLNRQQGFLEVVASRGFRSSEPSRVRVRLGQAPAGQVALERQAMHISDLAAASPHSARSHLFAREDFVTYSGVPLVTKGEVLGVLEVYRRAAFDGGTEWVQFLEMLAAQVAIAVENAQMFSGLQRSNMDLTFAYDTTIEGWSQALDLRDKETEGHSQRVTSMTVDLARAMGVGEGDLVHIRRGALLHDIGKMGVPDNILLKPGPLTEEEWTLMRRHPQHAYNLLSPIVYLRLALDIPYAHHEKWDGTGYPQGLKGEQIPLAARIFAVADVYDALLADRPYRPAWTREQTLAHIEAQAGIQFDPQVVKVLLQSEVFKR